MHSFASGFLHSTLCLWVIHAFACSCNILIYIALYISLCEYTTIYPLMNIWVVSNLKQLANNVAMNILSLTFSIYVHTFLLGVFSKNKIWRSWAMFYQPDLLYLWISHKYSLHIKYWVAFMLFIIYLYVLYLFWMLILCYTCNWG